MVIQSRTIVGALAAFAVLGVAAWMTGTRLNAPQAGTVEITQLEERSWNVEIRDMNEPAAQTASR